MDTDSDSLKYGLSRKIVALIFFLCSVDLCVLLRLVIPRWSWINIINETYTTPTMAVAAGVWISSIIAMAGIFISGRLTASCRWRLAFAYVVCFAAGLALDRFILEYCLAEKLNHCGYIFWSWLVVMYAPVLAGLIRLWPSLKNQISDIKDNSRATVLKGILLCQKCGADLTSSEDLVCKVCGSSYMLGDLMAYNASRISGETDLEVSNEA